MIYIQFTIYDHTIYCFEKKSVVLTTPQKFSFWSRILVRSTIVLIQKYYDRGCIVALLEIGLLKEMKGGKEAPFDRIIYFLNVWFL